MSELGGGLSMTMGNCGAYFASSISSATTRSSQPGASMPVDDDILQVDQRREPSRQRDRKDQGVSSNRNIYAATLHRAQHNGMDGSRLDGRVHSGKPAASRNGRPTDDRCVYLQGMAGSVCGGLSTAKHTAQCMSN